VAVKQIIIPRTPAPGVGKKFVKYVLDAKRFTDYVKASNGRWFPCSRTCGDPFFHDPKDRTSRSSRTSTELGDRPLRLRVPPRLRAGLHRERLGKAISRCHEKWSDEQAVDEAVNRIQTIMRAWK